MVSGDTSESLTSDLVVLRGSSNLSALIDRRRKAVVATGECAQVLKAAASPHERMGNEKVHSAYRVEASGHWSKHGGIGNPDDRAHIVDYLNARLAVDATLRTAERAQVNELVMMVLGRLCPRRRATDCQKGASQGYRNEPPHDSEIDSALLWASPGELRRGKPLHLQGILSRKWLGMTCDW